MMHEQYPDKLFVPLDDEIRELIKDPFGILEFMTDDSVYESPFFRARFIDNGEMKTMDLHWFNTTVRLFAGKPWATHLDLYDEDGKSGIAVSEEIADYLLDLGYPYLEMPYIDSNSMEWLAAIAMKDIDTELGEL